MATQNPDIQFQIFDTTTTPDWTMLGELDISSNKDFPLAITFSIKDVMDITKSKGSYSKTFKIPATRHNNDILENIFADGFYNSEIFVSNKFAKIYSNSQLIMEGQFRLKATVIDDKPLEYECIVFGENFEWVTALDGLNVCDLEFTIGDMFSAYPHLVERTFDSVQDTWNYNDSTHLRSGVGTHIVYPLLNRGKWLVNNQVHYTDLIPAFWVRNLVYQMFIVQGYTLVSNFFDSDWFKRLITVFPTDDGVWEQTVVNQVDDAYNGEIVGPAATEWKIPKDYRDPAIGNRFDGALLFTDITFVPPNNNSNWSAQNIEINSCNNDMWKWNLWGGFGGTNLSIDDRSISGWYWGRHGGAINNFSYGQSFNRLDDVVCCPPIKNIWGHEWGEIWEWASGYCAANRVPTCADTHNYTLNNVAIFTPTTADEYAFSGEFVLEMDNDYVRDNEPEPYDCEWGSPGIYGGGFFYLNDGYWYDDPAYGYGWDVGGSYFAGAVYLAWVHYDENYTEFIKLDKCVQSSIFYGGNWYYNGYFQPVHSPLPADPDNIEFPLSYSNVIVDVPNTNDRFYIYMEVNEEFHTEHGFAGLGIGGYCQCKYRIKEGALDGGLTSAVTTATVTNINVATLLPCDMAQLDFVNGLTGLFNLYWKSDEENKIVYVEPRDDFFLDRTQAVDWSEKLDFRTKQTSKFIYDALNRDLCFTYEEDGSDGFVEERNRLTGQVCSLYSYAMDLGSLYKDEESKIGTNLFAPTYMFRDKTIGTNQGKSPFIPVIHSEYQNIWNVTDSFNFPDKMTDFSPRVLLWAGLIPLNKEDGPTSTNMWRWSDDNPVPSPIEKKHYPAAMMYYDEDEQFFPPLTVGGYTYYPTLPYNDIEANRVEPIPIPPATYPFCAGLYQVFWERSIENMLQRPRVKKAKFYFTTNDIAQLDLRKLVYLKTGTEDTYWIINRIIDYKPGKNLLTQVELYQFIPATPTRRNNNPKFNRSNEVSVTRDYVTGQGRLVSETNFGALGSIGGITRNNNNMQTPIRSASNYNPNNNIGNRFEANVALGNSNQGLIAGDGRSMVKHPNSPKSSNYGHNNLVQQNRGTLAVGNNLNNLRSNTIYVGYGSGTINPHPIQFVQGGKTSLAIDGSGNVLEGGGGAIMAQDASGNYFEVYSESNFAGEINVRKILKSQ
tara:strand:+ start:4484 stop:7978 length:3495 start_codon:yes stop_codon:yes gene_type:complete